MLQHQEPTAAPQAGEVSQWMEVKGYGFITFDDGKYAYVHQSQVEQPPLHKGDRVIAVIVEDQKNPGKWQAMSVSRTAPFAGRPQQQQYQQVPVEPLATGDALVGEIEATVIEWNEKGFGFLQLADGRRAYVHHTIANGNLNVGQVVFVTVTEDAKNPGKWQAASVTRKAQPTDSETRIEGTVLEWSSRGFGFIQIPERRKAYVHRSSLEDSDALEVGETVTALVVPDTMNRGKYQAKSVLRGPLGDDGAVAEWRHGHGFGFMQMDDGRRCYIHRSAFGGEGDLQVGMRLRCIVIPDARNPGKWSIQEVRGELPQPHARDMLDSRDGSPLPLSLPGTIPEVAAAVNALTLVVEAQQSARVAEWTDRGYGFVMAADGRRAYIHRSVVVGGSELLVGDELTVVLEPDPKSAGKWTCRTAIPSVGTLLRNSPSLTPPPPPARSNGQLGIIDATVIQWNESAGFGFVQCDDGRKAYIHRSAFGGQGDLSIDDRLEVMITNDDRNPGKFAVREVLRILSSAPSRGQVRPPDRGMDEYAPPAKRQRYP